MAKYKKGDKVRVRNELEDYKVYYNDNKEEDGGAFFVNGMRSYMGEIVTIVDVIDRERYYHIEEDDEDYYWTDEMFVSCGNFEVEE